MSWCSPPEANEYDDDYLDWSDDDNNVCTSSKYVISSSSDEDAEHFLARIKSRKFVKKAKVSDGKDDFEREMASELSTTMQQLTASICKQSTNNAISAATENTSEGKAPEESSEFYDEIYFDSDDSDTEESSHKASGSSRRKGNRRILSNDELFYDPKMDDRDQAWMDKMRRSYQVKNKKRPIGNCKTSIMSQPLPESDAVLNCPACLTMLCMDCQRHELYTNQYRAMFVFNCNIDWTELLKFPKKNQKKKEFFKNKKKFKKMQEEVKEIPSNQQKMDVQVKDNSGDKTIQVSVGDASKADESNSVAAESTTEGSNSVAAKCTTKGSNSVAADSTTEGSNSVAAESTTEGSNPVVAKSSTKILVSGSELEVSVNTNKLAESKCIGSNPEEELFHPVMCKICNTKVAVYDKEEVYHFFNIVTSY